MKKYIVLLILIGSLSSCVSNKELTYLQGKPTSSSEIKRINNIPYKLQIDDILNITITSKNKEIVEVFQKGNLNNSTAGSSGGGQGSNQGYFSDYSIDNYGNIRVPTLGEMNVLGYTEVEVRKKIESKLREEYIKSDESLFISVKLSGIRYTIIGEINQPGTNIIYQNRVSIIDAVANSGDMTDVGNRQSVEIVRRTVNGTEKFVVDLTNIDVLNSEVFYIKPNDIINIKPLKEKSWGTGKTGLQSLSTIVSLFTLITSTIILARNL
ncbi:polysaccharide biosynthesis/export family protein [Polaribacter sp. PL03]|uniref:polysaccharide biosynthesis/export family protein n=1 Tax=Polaribacter sp. PL03 TaxID=3088353 RepID=UPI0029CC7BFC|nr:polysaccharide biosynthesis/export family protein [Polaribacter sp. PL03]MDX6746232.1 polysaccharide biosynthesis/export family protein [Polaribacter sp. PL03]